MNRQDILNMKPGRELDLLVAERVLNLNISRDNEGKASLDESFSTDITKLGTIIESMIEKEFRYSITNLGNGEHTCVFDSINTHKRYAVHSKDLVEAVCKASVLAVISK